MMFLAICDLYSFRTASHGKISFANALRLITPCCLTGKAGYSITGLRAEIEKLLTKILKHLIPKHKSNRHYPRKSKKGKYQKYV
jgi:hypothetical protein